MPQIYTQLTGSLGVDVPIICPPMAGATGGRLAAEVTLASGFGFIGVGYMDRAAFMQESDMVRSILDLPPEAPLAVGAGFLCWILDQEAAAVEALNAALEQRVKAVWLSFGNDIGKWVEHVRDYDARRAVSHKTAIWVLASTVKEAERAANEWRPDVLVVQGGEAGGHGLGDALPLLSLFPLVKQALPDGPPLVAAGGIANGAQAAALLVLGAAGVVIGTRYLATPESTYSRNQKDAVVSASYSIRTTAFDTARGTVGWPEGVDGRGLRNKTVEDALNGVPLENQMKAYDEALKRDDVSRKVVWSGASVALVNEIVGAGVLTRKLGEELVQTLQQAQSLTRGINSPDPEKKG